MKLIAFVALLGLQVGSANPYDPSQMRATIDAVGTYRLGDGRYTVLVWGWAAGNGFTPDKAVFVDGRRVPSSSVERHDVCDRLLPFGWTCDDGKPHQCDLSGTPDAPCPACMGIAAYHGFLSPGKHTITLCATGATYDTSIQPAHVCDTRIVQ